jgi:hypothetical protein
MERLLHQGIQGPTAWLDGRPGKQTCQEACLISGAVFTGENLFAGYD